MKRLKDNQYIIWRTDNVMELVICVLIFGMLIICALGTFNFDDVTQFYFKGREILTGESFADILKGAYTAWIQRGRFSPIALITTYIIYYIFTEYWLYECLIIVFTCFDVWLFGRLIEMLMQSQISKYLSMMGMALFFQVYTSYHNALVGYALLMQNSVALTLLQMIFLQNYLKNRKKIFLISSVICQLLSVLIYEFNYFNIFLTVILLFYNKETNINRLKIVLFNSIPLLFIGVYSVYINFTSNKGGTVYSGSKLELDLFVSTLGKQLFATFPLSNYLTLKNSSDFSNKKIFELLNMGDIALIVLFCFLLYILWNKVEEDISNRPNIWLILLAIWFYVSPAFLPALTSKYQNELYWGIAHISVYQQYFGLCFCLILFLQWILYLLRNKTKIRQCFKIIFSLIMAFVCTINLSVTNYYIKQVENAVKYPKDAIIHAIKSDLLNEITSDDILVIPQPAPWDISTMFSQFANKKVHSYPVSDLFSKSISGKMKKNILCDTENNLFALRYSGSLNYEMAILGDISCIEYDDQGNFSKIYVNSVKVFANKNASVIKSSDYTFEDVAITKDITSLNFDTPIDFYSISIEM